jgi:hypothetical protein
VPRPRETVQVLEPESTRARPHFQDACLGWQVELVENPLMPPLGVGAELLVQGNPCCELR